MTTTSATNNASKPAQSADFSKLASSSLPNYFGATLSFRGDGGAGLPQGGRGTQQQQQPAAPFNTTTTPSFPPSDHHQQRSSSNSSEYHLERIITNLQVREREDSRKRLDDILESKQKKRHEEFLSQILSEIHGGRTLGGSSKIASTSTTSSSSSVSAALGITTTATTASPQQAQQQQQDAINASAMNNNIALLLSYLNIVRRWNREWKMPLSNVVEHMSQVVDDDNNGNSHASSSSSFEVWRLVDQVLERRPSSSIGALSHSCLQFAEIVQTRVRNATLAGQNVTSTEQYSNSLAQSVAAYVKLTTLSSSVWATVYYCLRCGDAVAAWNVLSETTTTTHSSASVTAAIRTILSQWSQAQGRAPLLWDATQNLMTMTDRAARQTVTDLYERGGANDGDDAFYAAVLGLLSMNDPILDSESVIQTSEDYLFAWLWYVQSSEARRVELSDALRELGPSHFPDSPWGYALPLMAAQEYTKALEHLMKLQASIPAVHVALVLHEAGVLSGGEEVVTRLILEHAALLQKHDATAAVEYLIRLPDEQRRMKEIARLAVETNQMDRLPLQELASDVAVSAIKMEASKQAKAKGDYDMAARLLFHSGHYNALLALLNELLSSEMAKQGKDCKWRESCKTFHQDLLTNAHSSPVLHTLQSQGHQEQLSTFRLLLQMNAAFELVRDTMYNKALTMIDELPLLPLTESECQGKIRQYHSLDMNIKKVFPVLLDLTMVCLSSIYTRLGASGYDRGSSDAERNRLRKKAQLLLFSFGSNLQSEIPREVFDRMAQMERIMV